MQLAPELQKLLFGFAPTDEDSQLQQHLEGTSLASSLIVSHTSDKIFSENALSYLRRKKVDAVQTGIEPFDSMIGEMKLSGTVIELYGNEGQGITQTCYTSMCHLALPSHYKVLQFTGDAKTKPREGYHVLYFDLDDKFDKHRFIEIIEMTIYKAFFDYLKLKGKNVPFGDITEEMIVSEVFDSDDSNYKSFILDVLSRVHIFRIENSFQLAIAFEALYRRHLESNRLRDKYILDIEDEEDYLATQRRIDSTVQDKEILNQINCYKAIVINSMTQYHKSFLASDRKNWERAFEILLKLTHSKQLLTITTIYDSYSKQSRQKYNQKKNTAFYQGANRHYNDDRLANELIQLHRDVLRFPTWSQNVNYRLLFGGDYPETTNQVKYAHLQTLNSATTTSHTNTPHLAPHQQHYKDLYKIQILDYGTHYFK